MLITYYISHYYIDKKFIALAPFQSAFFSLGCFWKALKVCPNSKSWPEGYANKLERRWRYAGEKKQGDSLGTTLPLSII